jgi:hypothetical protein
VAYSNLCRPFARLAPVTLREKSPSRGLGSIGGHLPEPMICICWLRECLGDLQLIEILTVDTFYLLTIKREPANGRLASICDSWLLLSGGHGISSPVILRRLAV